MKSNGTLAFDPNLKEYLPELMCALTAAHYFKCIASRRGGQPSSHGPYKGYDIACNSF
jgi:hypothetical protein